MSARTTGSPILANLEAGTFPMTYPLYIDVTNPYFTNISVTITGQGPDKTVLDCQGYGRAVAIVGAGSVSISNLTIQNCDTINRLPGYSPVPMALYDGRYTALIYLAQC